jgi:threonine/homoserine/homoserine lactone efflux protein
MDYLLLIGGGFLIGMIVAAPIGPVNVICIRRTLAYGPINGFLSGLGAAVGDGIFAVIAAFGLTAAAQLIEGYTVPLKVIGGSMLIAFGIHIFNADVSALRDEAGLPVRDAGSSSLVRTILSTFALTMTNPATMFGFAALFTGLGTFAGGADATFLGALITVAAVVSGSAAWWFAVTAVTGIFHRKITALTMHRINEISGIVVGGFGLVVLGTVIYEWLK